MSWARPLERPLNTASCSLLPITPSRIGEEERKNKSKKTCGSRLKKKKKNTLISEGKWNKIEENKTSDAKVITHHFPWVD